MLKHSVLRRLSKQDNCLHFPLIVRVRLLPELVSTMSTLEVVWEVHSTDHMP